MENDVDKEDHEQFFEDSYFKCMAQARSLIEGANVSLNATQVSGRLSESSSNSNSAVKLPIIELSKFNVEVSSLLSFKNMYLSIIHENTNIADVQKFHYLRAALEGTAQEVINSITFSAMNYNIAWESLCERFNNKNLLIYNHVKALFNLPSLTSESSSGLRNLIDEVSKNLRALNTLGQNTTDWDCLITFMIRERLDPGTVREWEQHCVKDEIPTLEEMIAFIRGKADLLKTLELKMASSNPKPKVANK